MAFTIITAKDEAAKTAARWKRLHYRRGQWRHTARGSSKDIYEALVALGTRPDPAQVDQVTGDISWTTLMCTHCRRDLQHALVLIRSPEQYHDGDEDDYERQRTEIALCLPCAQKLRQVIVKMETLIEHAHKASERRRAKR